MFKKLHISLIFSNLKYSKIFKLNNHCMYNLYVKFVKFLEICKQFSGNLVNERGNIRRPGPLPRFSDLEVIALSLAAESEGIDSENWLFDHKLEDCKSEIPNLISRRQFNDRRKTTDSLCEEIRKLIAGRIDGGEDYFCIDSRPVEVCRPARGRRCKMGRTSFEKAPDFGYCASQKVYYYGYKLYALCGLSGVIHSYDLSKASVHDINYLQDVRQVYHDCNIIGDKGYLSADIQLDLFETAHIRLECPYRKNQKDRKPIFVPFAKARKRIETIFSQLTDQFMIIRNYAKETDGLFTRIIGKISAQTFLQYINYVNGKPIGKIKYALN
ncbi:MAG: IS982 family transposase [Prevotella sp.]|nr:IS982 family transposase [Prevotella sp.]MCH3992309.1 IS982 family transposase [Prevotella sp.]